MLCSWVGGWFERGGLGNVIDSPEGRGSRVAVNGFVGGERWQAESVGRGFAEEGNVDSVKRGNGDGEASTTGVFLVGDVVIDNFSGVRVERDAIVLGSESAWHDGERGPDAVFVIGQGEHPQEPLAVLEKVDVFLVLRPKVDFGAIRGTDATLALKVDFAFAAPKPVATGNVIALSIAGAGAFSGPGGLGFFVDFWMKVFVEVEGEVLCFLRSRGQDEEKNAFHGEQGHSDGEEVEPAGRSCRFGHGAGGLVSLSPNEDASEEGGDCETDAENGVPDVGRSLQQDVSGYDGNEEGHRSH